MPRRSRAGSAKLTRAKWVGVGMVVPTLPVIELRINIWDNSYAAPRLTHQEAQEESERACLHSIGRASAD
jgi:hypothetical protein